MGRLGSHAGCLVAFPDWQVKSISGVEQAIACVESFGISVWFASDSTRKGGRASSYNRGPRRDASLSAQGDRCDNVTRSEFGDLGF